MIDGMKTGDRVLICSSMRHLVFRGLARFRSGGLHTPDRWDVYDEHVRSSYAVNLSADEEGLMWCREWDGPVADAFRVQLALR